jgi:hypothetical protein
MTDELTQYLVGDRKHAKISPEMLEMMGKQAANMYLSDRIALNEGVAKLAGAFPDINAEQIKRVCEFANTAVYLGIHDKDKTASADSSYPQFDLADAGRVVQDLSDGARPTRVSQVDADYGRQPAKMQKVASATSDALLADLFQVGKSEELPFTKAAAIEDIAYTKDDLKGMKGHLEDSASKLAAAYADSTEEFYGLAKQHILDGGSFADVIRAAQVESVPYEKVASALHPFVVRLLKEKVASADELKADVAGLEKVAHRVINEQHPMVTSFRAILSLDHEIQKVASGLDDVNVQITRVDAFLRENLHAPTAP